MAGPRSPAPPLFPVPGSTAAPAVVSGALAADSFFLTAPREAPGATREGV